MAPMLALVDGKSYGKSFLCFYFFGILFFSGTLGWFVYVTYPGAVLLIAYLSVYFGIFGLALRFFSPLPLLARIVILPSVWVVLEFARAHMLSGFGWVLLGHSQHTNILLIQIADVTGVYGVSFLVMMVNVLFFESVCRRNKESSQDLRWAQILTAGMLAVAFVYGAWRISHTPQASTVHVGVVQPNIPQALKWDENLQGWIIDETLRLSRELARSKPEVIIWPETSLPGIIGEEGHLVSSIKSAAKDMSVPLLIGAITQENRRYYNSAYLISAQGEVVNRYDKIHLVPFGEYLPLRRWLGWVSRFVPLEDFSAGGKYVIFEAGGKEKLFGTLICFEDTVSAVRRSFVNQGAGFLVNMTNDAWFMDTKAPFLHLQSAVFGAAENKRSLVRSANTGFSGFVDPYGRIIASAQDSTGKKTFVSAYAAAQVPVMTVKTLYTKYGDFFTWGCLFAILGAGLILRRAYAQKSSRGGR